MVNLQLTEFNAASLIYSFKLETMLLIPVNAFPKSVLAPISIKDFKSQRLQYALMCELRSLPSTHHGMNRLLKLHIRSQIRSFVNSANALLQRSGSFSDKIDFQPPALIIDASNFH